MVFKKGLDNEFHRFNVCIIPRAPRSKRRRLPHKSAVEDTQICAFELLASLAGKLLQESESSSASSNASEGNDHPHIHKDVIKQEQQHEYKQLKAECNDQGSCEASVDISESTTEKSNGKCLPSQFPRVVDGYLKTTGSQSKKAYGNFPSKLEGVSSDSGESSGGFMENAFGQRQEAERLGNEGLTMAKICHSKDSTDLRMAYPALINPDRHVNLRSCRDHISNVSFAKHRNDLKLRSRDDDENFSRCYKFSNKFKAYRPPTRIGDRRIRKLLTSKYWKVAPKLKDFELSRSDGGMKPLYQKRKINYRHERYKYDALYKKRRLSDRSSVVTSDGVFSSESVSNSPQKGMNGEKSGTAAMFHGGGVPASITGHQVSHQSKDSHVKFSIKSFKVPELFIEVPESATLGSLKRTVMEAVTALLGGGIRVGVLVQGKKVRDDSRTLSQTGISCKEKLETLGFSLEPSPSQAPAPVCSDDPSLLLPYDATKLPLRSPATPALDSEPSDSLPDPPPLNNPDNYVENNHELSPPYSDSLDNKTLSDSRALVPVPAMSVKALAVVPVNQKMRRSELAQRRTRRPFSVSEVEALVQAVEELGTGRWRDVKLRAFENADHRTYVDLKDKWKTLVHTARIAPQQRRGEPVPQELLDRVLAAHAFWSQHQAKQQGKRQAGTGTLKITDGQPERSGDGAIQLM